MLMLKLIRESFLFAVNSLTTNKLRTFLSLLGITIGIFAIISVFTVVDSLEKKIRDSIESLGSSVVYIQKWPWEFGSEYAWWKYMNRPQPGLKDFEILKAKSQKASDFAFVVSARRPVQYEKNTASNASIEGASHEYDNIRNFEISKGRYFSTIESAKGYAKAVIGESISKELFGKLNPVGRTIKVDGFKVMVVGVFKKQGKDMFENSIDNVVLLPINFVRNLVDVKSESLNPMIMAKSAEGVSTFELIEELRGIMRSARRLKPIEDDNFALNRTSMISQAFDQVFGVINIAGLVIGGFSILVGGFGIANIMFVSVKERTKIIGIQKSLGAKRYFILLQFLYESVILSLFGGIIGILLIFLGTVAANNLTEFEISLSTNNIVTGILISICIGVISGYAPAYSAAKMDPVKAIASN